MKINITDKCAERIHNIGPTLPRIEPTEVAAALGAVMNLNDYAGTIRIVFEKIASDPDWFPLVDADTCAEIIKIAKIEECPAMKFEIHDAEEGNSLMGNVRVDYDYQAEQWAQELASSEDAKEAVGFVLIDEQGQRAAWTKQNNVVTLVYRSERFKGEWELDLPYYGQVFRPVDVSFLDQGDGKQSFWLTEEGAKKDFPDCEIKRYTQQEINIYCREKGLNPQELVHYR